MILSRFNSRGKIKGDKIGLKSRASPPTNPLATMATLASRITPQLSNRLRKNRLPQNILILILTLSVLFFNTGCWDKREIENLAFITAWGLDQQENGEILVSAIIVKPFAITGPAGGGTPAPERPFWLASCTGRTVLEAMCNFANFSPRFLFCAHSRFLVLGEEGARAGVGDLLDFFVRNREPRLTTHLFVVKDMTAAEFLKSEFELTPLPPEGGQGMIQNAANRLGNVVDININDFLIMLAEEGIEPVSGCWEVIPKRPVPLEGELKREEIIQSPIFNGAAAFKEDRLIGWLSPEETRGLQWIRGRIKSTPIVVENPADAPRLIGIEVIRARSAITPSLAKGKASMHIEIELEGNIEDVQGFFDPGTESDIIKKIESRMAKIVEKEVTSVLQRCQQELNTDIFGFGAAINRHSPKEWKKLKDRWDSEFPRIETSLDVKTHVRLSGLLVKSIKEQ